jgi:putative OPT family oligopeptide transporter
MERRHEPEPRARELTGRAVIAGWFVGLLLSISNVYLGLKIGFVETGQITAAIVGFALLGLRRSAGYTPLENNITQMTAASVAAIPTASGFIAGIPALQMMHQSFPGWAIAGWGWGIAVLGIFIAMALRHRLIVEERLPFPTGIATAEVISAMHSGRQEGAERARAFAGSALASGLFTFLREAGPSWMPHVSLFRGQIRGVSASSLSLGFAWNPILLGIGMVMGLRGALGLALGSVIAWIGMAPTLVKGGIVSGASYHEVVAWLIWPGVGCLIGATIASLGSHFFTAKRAISDLRSIRSQGSVSSNARCLMAIAIAAVVVLFLSGWFAFGLSPLHLLVALAVLVITSGVSARSAGETDIIPSSQLGQLTQLVDGLLAPGRAAATVPVAVVIAGNSSQVGTSLWSLGAGDRLRASPSRQMWAALAGCSLGAVFGFPIYLAVTHAYGLGTATLPAPAALQWKAVAELAAEGGGHMPQMAAASLAAAALISFLLTLGARYPFGRFLPSPFALGIGLIIPGSFVVTLVCGTIISLLVKWTLKRSAASRIPTWAAGAIVGESVVGVAVALLSGLGVLAHR